MPQIERMRTLVTLGFVVFIAAAAGACAPEPPDEPRADQEAPLVPPEGEINVAQPVVQQAYFDFLQQFVTEPCDDIRAALGNEAHDCQRFVRPQGGEQPGEGTGPQLEFGPLIGILPDLSAVDEPLAFFLEAPRVVARVANAGSLSGDDSYPALGIGYAGGDTVTVYCLWLRYEAEAERWRAAMLADATSVIRCAQQPTDDQWNLAVDRQLYGDAGPDLYPQTARIQWDVTGQTNRVGTHFLGVRCGDGWCAIGEDGFTPEPIPDPVEEPDPLRAIDGWFDAQFLAVPEPGPGEDLIPGPWAVLFPQNVGIITDWEHGAHVATIELIPGGGPGMGAYQQKFNLPSGGNPRVSEIWLSWGGDPDVPPQSEYRSAMNTPKGATSVEVSGQPHASTGAARWQWKDTDETAWVYCPYYGCCDVQEAF